MTRAISVAASGAERLADELERVAQPLAGDPQLVERLDVGPAQDRLVGADLLVRGLDPRGGGVADAVRLGRADRSRRARPSCRTNSRVVVEPAPVAVGVELADEQHAGVVAVDPPGGEERLERALLADGQVRSVGVGGLEQDVEVADGPEPRGDLAEAAAVRLRPAGAEGLAEDPPGRPLPPGRDPHRVEVLGVGAFAGAGLLGDHPREVEAEDLAAGLGEVVVGEHARRLADDEPGRSSPSARRRSLRRGRRPGADAVRVSAARRGVGARRVRRRASAAGSSRRAVSRGRRPSVLGRPAPRRAAATSAIVGPVVAPLERRRPPSDVRRQPPVACPARGSVAIASRERGLQLRRVRRREPGSAASTRSIAMSPASSPLTSSTSSSTNRPTTRLAATASTSSRLSSTVVPSP